jgi:hypothetical protein
MNSVKTPTTLKTEAINMPSSPLLLPALNVPSLAANTSSTDGESVEFSPINGIAEGNDEGKADGSLDGTGEGIMDGPPDGIADGNSDMVSLSFVESPPGIKIPMFSEGMEDGIVDGMMDGRREGNPDGISDCNPDGNSDGIPDGNSDGIPDGIIPDGTVDGTELGKEEPMLSDPSCDGGFAGIGTVVAGMEVVVGIFETAVRVYIEWYQRETLSSFSITAVTSSNKSVCAKGDRR